MQTDDKRYGFLIRLAVASFQSPVAVHRFPEALHDGFVTVADSEHIEVS